MKNHRLQIAIFVLLVFAATPVAFLYGETEVLHGADSTFRTEALGICWGIVKAPVADSLQVVTRIQVLDPEKNPFKSFAVKAFHPFTGAAEWIAARQPIETTHDIISPREDFKRLGGRQIHFYHSVAGPADQAPDMVVEYLGIPDTTPELSDTEGLERYFAVAFERLTKP